MPNFRKLWFEFVSEVRRKKSTKKKKLTHAEAMKIASEKWPKKKAQLQRKHAKELKNKVVVPEKISSMAPIIESAE